VVVHQVFISARPHVYKDVSESASYAKFRKLQAQRGMHCTPTLLPGSIDSGKARPTNGGSQGPLGDGGRRGWVAGVKLVFERDMEPLSRKKLENFEQFVSLYPEYTFVFIGEGGRQAQHHGGKGRWLAD
jgi:hypothetical protein